MPASAVSQIPFAFVENRGQADASVVFIGRGPDSLALFRASGVVYRTGIGQASLQFEGTEGAARIEGGDATGARLNHFEGADPARWVTNIPMLSSIRYRSVWPGIDLVFRAAGETWRPEFLLREGASGDGVRIRFNEPVSVEPDGSATIGTGTRSVRLARPLVETTLGGVARRGEASYRIHSDGSLGISALVVTRQGPVAFTPNLLFSGYVGGPSENTATASVVNSSYNVIVAGWALGSDMPVTGAIQSVSGGSVDAYVAGFSSTGGALIFCTYLGGSGDDRAFGVAVDSSNNIYLTGWTSSGNFPVRNPIQSKPSGSRDAFIAKLNPAGSALVYSTYLGGTGVDQGNAIAVSSAGEALVVGDTTSSNLKVTGGAFQTRLGGTQDAFVAMLNPAGTAIEALTYLGGGAVEHGTAAVIDSSNNVIVAGSTYSNNFPTVSAEQPHSGGGQDGFLTKFSPGLQQAVFSTYFGGSAGSAGAPEQINCLGLRPSGNILVGGVTSSTNLPVTSGAPQNAFAGGNTDGFFGRFSSTGALQIMSYLGGSSDDGVNAMTLDFDGLVYLAGFTTSTDFPLVNSLQGPGGGMDAFVVKTNLSAIYFATYLGGNGNDSAAAISVDSLTSITVSGSTSSANFPVAGAVAAWPGGGVESFMSRISPHFTLALSSAPTFLYDVWHDTGYNGSSLNLNVSSFGQSGDIPVVGDWTGTGAKRIGIFRNGTWLLDINGNGVFDAGDKTVSFGQAGDIPVVGDWTGTGTIKLGLFRQGSFILDLSGHLSGVPTGVSDAQFVFGQSGDIPIVADWNQTGTSKVGVFRSGSWLIDYAGSRLFSSHVTYTFGQAGDVPVVGDWTGDGLVQIGVYRAGLWILDYLNYTNMTYPSTFLLLTFGGAGYTPLVM
jgi:hypothetical protein